jgi:hypothetical protein
MTDERGTNRVPVGRFAEADYCYGTGSLILRIERVDWSSPQKLDGENWYEVYGMEMTEDGREVGRRQALVRGRRLPPNTGPRYRPPGA